MRARCFNLGKGDPMRSRSVYLFHVAFAVLLLLAAAPASALDIVINNGFAPPNPANVIDDDTYYFDSVYVRNVGCPPGWPTGNASDPCPSPGAPTEVALVSGGEVDGGLHAYDSSSITFSGGGAAFSLYAHDSSSITMSDSGWVAILYSYDSSNIAMSGGNMTDMRTYGSATATLSGGQAQMLQSRDSSNITVSGGWTEYLWAFDSSTLTIVGYNFAVDGSPVPYGDLTALTGTLTGTLDSGESIESFFEQGGGSYTGIIELVPEPSTALLLALGLGGIAAGRRRRAR
jgi:hypothetical protein